MSIVLIFTNYDSWRPIHPSASSYDDWENNYPGDSSPIKKCVFHKGGPATLETATSCKEDGVYLVYDKINALSFADLEKLTREKESYVLVHSNGMYHEEDIPTQGKRMTRFGIHNDDDHCLYYPCFEILTDGKGDELKRIVSLFNPSLEAVLRFLNECLMPGNANPQLEDSFKKICSDAGNNEKVRKAVTGFYEKYKGHKSLEDYEEDLNQIRDILIDFATAK